MKKINNLFATLLFTFTIIILVLFFFLYKIETNLKYYNSYMDSFDELINVEIELNTFLEKRDKFVDFDLIVKKINRFEIILLSLKNSGFKDEFGEESYIELDNIYNIYKKKKALIEKFKSRQSTNLNSIHYVYELNQHFARDNRVEQKLKSTINSTLFMIMQYFINLNNTKTLILENLRLLDNENKKLLLKELDLLVIHSKIILQNIEYMNKIKENSDKLNLKQIIENAHNELIEKHEDKFFYQRIISSFFFLSLVLMIGLIYKEHKKAQKIKDELSAFKYAVENSDNSVVLTDVDRNILYVNDIFEKNTGFKKNEVSGQKPKMLSSGQTPEKTYEELNRKLALGQKWEGEFVNKRKDGTLFYEKASIVPIFVDGKIKNYLAIKLDITKYIEQNEQIKLSSIAFNNIQEGIMVCNSKKQIITINKAYEDISGYKKEELIGKRPNIFRFAFHDRTFYKKVIFSLEQNGSWKGQIYDKNKNGDINAFWLNISVVKDNNDEVTKYVAVHTSLQEIIESKEKADFLAYHDSLTKLPNRLKLENELINTLNLANRNNFNIFVLFIDLDRFKIINDTLGHSVGDKLLIKIANRIKSVLRQSDILARMGGDEFIVVLESCKSKKSAGYVCEKILNIVKEPITIENSVLNTSASIGVAMFPDDGFDKTTLIKNADTAMYHAKKLGKDTYQYYDKQLSLDVHEQLQIEQALKEAVINNEIYLNYQAQYNLKNKKIVAFEALVRWEHPLFGLISPDKFIPIAEDTGDIIEIGKFVFESACRDFVEFKKENKDLEYIAINISSIQFKDKNFVNDISFMLDKYKLKPSEIELEITERYIIDFTEHNLNSLNSLRRLGFRFSVDDFGTGYSSLSYLTKLPIDVLKVDKTFIDGTPNDNNNVQISKAIIALSKSLGYKVVAEGIEYKEQEEYLKKLDCDMGQGYLFCKPLNFKEIIDLLKR